MSHVTTIDLEIKDTGCLKDACDHLGYDYKEGATVSLYERTAVFKNCTAIQMPGWNYPVALKDGRLHYDNYGGAWGNISSLDALRQRYARNVAVKEAKRKGFRVTEKVENGSVKLRLSR